MQGSTASGRKVAPENGGKALTAAVKKHAGDMASIQRCQVHKRRNVLDHLTDEQKPAMAKRLNAAYALEKQFRRVQGYSSKRSGSLFPGSDRQRRAIRHDRIDPADPAIVITPTGSGGFVVQLQADRLGNGTGGVYTLTAQLRTI